MKKNPLLAILSLGFLAVLSACETVPASSEMDLASFADLMARAQANPSAVAVDRDLSAVLDNDGLSDVQKADVHHLRATKRWRGGYNKPGAIADFDAFLSLSPADIRVATARMNRASAKAEIAKHEVRLAGLQSLRAWFDDKVALGDLPEAATRYRASGLTPTDRQVYTLREAGYICTDAAGGEPLHRYGRLPAYAANLVWCPGAPIT